MPILPRILLAALALAVAVSLLLQSSLVGDKQQKVLRLAHNMDTNHVVHLALVKFQQELVRLSDGRMDVDIYPSGQLGQERDLVELLQMGSVAMTKVSAATLEAFAPSMQLFNLPYVFRDGEHYWQVLNGEIGKQLLGTLADIRLTGLTYYDAGSRSFYTCNKPVYGPDDLVDMKIRTMNSQTAVQLMRALGAAATPISFGELYTALQQGVVDGAENNAITFYKSRHFEACKYYILDRHNAIPDVVVFSQHQWQRLSQQQQDWVQQALVISTDYQRQLWQQQTQEAMQALQDAGVQIVEADTQAFANKVAKFKRQFDGTDIGHWLNQIAQQ